MFLVKETNSNFRKNITYKKIHLSLYNVNVCVAQLDRASDF